MGGRWRQVRVRDHRPSGDRAPERVELLVGAACGDDRVVVVGAEQVPDDLDALGDALALGVDGLG
ncbi:MAG: hypothetical protein V9E94_01955 [Microthrixaceae bacterium]